MYPPISDGDVYKMISNAVYEEWYFRKQQELTERKREEQEKERKKLEEIEKVEPSRIAHTPKMSVQNFK